MLLNYHITILKKCILTVNSLCNPLLFLRGHRQASRHNLLLLNSAVQQGSPLQVLSRHLHLINNILSLGLSCLKEAVIMPMALKEKEKNLNLWNVRLEPNISKSPEEATNKLKRDINSGLLVTYKPHYIHQYLSKSTCCNFKSSFFCRLLRILNENFWKYSSIYILENQSDLPLIVWSLIKFD